MPLSPPSLWCPISPTQISVLEEHWDSVTQIEFSKGCIFLPGGEQSPGPYNDTGPTRDHECDNNSKPASLNFVV